MTFLKAVNSGYPFRRKAWAKPFPNEWYLKGKAGTGQRRGYKIWPFPTSCMQSLTEKGVKSLMYDITTTDWEIKK